MNVPDPAIAASADSTSGDASPLASRIAAAGLDWIVPRWPAPSRVRAFVTTRNGGVSAGPCASLDLGTVPPSDAARDELRAVAENRRRVQAFLPSAPAWLEQVHGADVAVVASQRAASPLRVDAAVTREAGVVLAVRVADCMPVLFADSAGEVVGIAHAGWRGLAAGVLENTVAAMRCAPEGVIAWLGPAIGPSAFEVGADVRDAFVNPDPRATAAFVAGRPGKWHADLEALARMRLARAGVASIHGGGMCTASDSQRFFSFRRDRATGRMAAFVWLA